MDFSNKIRALRKENGISQEELAHKLKVSRQAISKWENGQGFPEMDKLLAISNIFDVSLDYLLKEEGSAKVQTTEDGGYYLDASIVEEYLTTKSRRGSRMAIGIAIIIFSLSFTMFFPRPLGPVLFFLGAAVGISILVLLGFQPKFKGYDEIEERPLVFEPSFLHGFQERYLAEQKKSGLLIVSGIVLFILSLVAGILINEFTGNNIRYIAVLPLFWASAVGLLIFGITVMDAINIIANNEEYVNELNSGNGRGWIYAIAMPLTTIVFLGVGFIWNAWHPGWLLFPVSSLLCYAYTIWGED